MKIKKNNNIYKIEVPQLYTNKVNIYFDEFKKYPNKEQLYTSIARGDLLAKVDYDAATVTPATYQECLNYLNKLSALSEERLRLIESGKPVPPTLFVHINSSSYYKDPAILGI